MMMTTASALPDKPFWALRPLAFLPPLGTRGWYPASLMKFAKHSIDAVMCANFLALTQHCALLPLCCAGAPPRATQLQERSMSNVSQKAYRKRRTR